jgi:hypothetical protein
MRSAKAMGVDSLVALMATSFFSDLAIRMH